LQKRPVILRSILSVATLYSLYKEVLTESRIDNLQVSSAKEPYKRDDISLSSLSLAHILSLSLV